MSDLNLERAIDRILELEAENANLREDRHRLNEELKQLETAIEAKDAETAKLKAEIKMHIEDWCDDDAAIKQQALRVLGAKIVEGDTHFVPRMGALAELMADECLRVRAKVAKLRKLLLMRLTWLDNAVPSPSEYAELKEKVVNELKGR